LPKAYQQTGYGTPAGEVAVTITPTSISPTNIFFEEQGNNFTVSFASGVRVRLVHPSSANVWAEGTVQETNSFNRLVRVAWF
jgi:hypothetical protein